LGSTAERYQSASGLLADIVGFTPLSETLSTEQMVGGEQP